MEFRLRTFGVQFFSSFSGFRGDNARAPPLRFGSKRRAFRQPPTPLPKTTRLPFIPYKPTHRPKPFSQPEMALMLARKRGSLTSGSPLYYRVPLLITESRGQYVFDQQGRRYLDLFGGDGTIVVGHTHPLVVKAVQNQALKLSAMSHHYLEETSMAYIESLLSEFPSYLDACYLVSSESEATELAVLLARLSSRQFDLVTLRGSYFGFTHMANSMSGTALHKYPVPAAAGLAHLAVPDMYRSNCEPKTTINQCIHDVVTHIRSVSPGTLAGCLIESAQSLGGTVDTDRLYLTQISRLVKDRGGKVIIDESNTGLGRLGKNLWGFQDWGGHPDIVTISKGLANGLPLAAVVTTKDIASTLQQRVYVNYYAGNPLTCAAGSAVLRALKEDMLPENAVYVGGYLRTQLKMFQKRYLDAVGDIRLNGLLGAIEFVKSSVTKEPAPELTGMVHEALKNRGVLVGRGGIYGNVLRFSPPLCIIPEDVDFFVTQLGEALDTLLETESTSHPVIAAHPPITRGFIDNRYAAHEALLGNNHSGAEDDELDTSTSSEEESDTADSDQQHKTSEPSKPF